MSVTDYFASVAIDQAADTPRPKARRFTAPVYISDAVTPISGETVLSLLWRRMEEARDEDQS